MVDPVYALLGAVVLGVATVLLFWPVRGYMWRWLRALRATERVLTEDALKHLFNCEYTNRVANPESLAGALAASGARTIEILQRLEERELVRGTEGGYELTAEGRRYALRVVRIHRLWESYLSDHTGLGPADWHHEAEQREHTTSIEEADALSARMGDPRYDPHGDPIPTAGGEIAPPQGIPLTELPAGQLAEIVHIEDEPDAIYAQLVAEGLHPGMRVRILESTPRRLRFTAETEELVLAPIFAAAVSVLPYENEEEAVDTETLTRLSSLAIGDEGLVVSIASSLRPRERRRMLDLGLIPGTLVRAEIRSPAGDPTGYRIRGAVIALRRDQADSIQIEPVNEPPGESMDALAS